MKPLKSGQLCWLTKVKTPGIIGKVVEVIEYRGKSESFGDYYKVKSKEPLRIEFFHLGQHYSNVEERSEFNAMRVQLVPINDPDQTEDITTQIERQQQST